MEKTWTIANSDRALCNVPQLRPEFLKFPINVWRLFDVVQEGDVITGFDRRQVSLYDLRNGSFVAILFSVDRDDIVSNQLGAFLKAAASFKRAQQLLRRILRFLNIRLIEGIYSQAPTRTRGGKLPYNELCAEL